MDTTPVSLPSESGTPDILQRLTDFTDALYRASVASPVPIDWTVLQDAALEIERLRKLTEYSIELVDSNDSLICSIEGKDAENIVQIATQSYVLDALKMALNSPPDG